MHRVWYFLVAQAVESTCHAGDPGSIPGSGRSSGGGHSNPLQCSCLESPVDRGAWRATVVHGLPLQSVGHNRATDTSVLK